MLAVSFRGLCVKLLSLPLIDLGLWKTDGLGRRSIPRPFANYASRIPHPASRTRHYPSFTTRPVLADSYSAIIVRTSRSPISPGTLVGLLLMMQLAKSSISVAN